MATNNNEQIVLGLDITKTVKQINADIKKLQGKLEKVKVSGTLDAKSTAKEINAQIKALKSQLKAVNLKADDTGFKDVSESLQSVADSAKKAEKQIASAADSMQSKLKPLKEIGLGIVKNIFSQDDIKTITDLVKSLQSGSFSDISFDKIKNIGKLRMSVRI